MYSHDYRIEINCLVTYYMTDEHLVMHTNGRYRAYLV